MLRLRSESRRSLREASANADSLAASAISRGFRPRDFLVDLQIYDLEGV
jgi:hypothetical protein